MAGATFPCFHILYRFHILYWFEVYLFYHEVCVACRHFSTLYRGSLFALLLEHAVIFW